MLRSILLALLTSFPMAALAVDEAPRPLEDLAARLPAVDAERVVLSDVAASSAEAAKFDAPLDDVDRRLSVYAPLTLIDGFDLFGSFAAARAGLEPVLGFDLDDIAQIASWPHGAEAPVVITGIADKADAVATALSERDFEAEEHSGRTVWWRQDDLSTEPDRAEEDPFAQGPGHAARFGFADGALFFARGWAGFDALMAEGPRLIDEREVRAILSAGYALEDRGRLVEAILLDGQTSRAEAVRAAVGTEPGSATRVDELMRRAGMRRPPMPGFERHGLLLWQDGLRVTGALVIPYPDRETAREARERFETLLDTVRSVHVAESFGELLPYTRRFTIVEAEERAVLVLGFEEIVPDEPIMPMMLVTNPYDRLRDFQFAGDLAVLLGHDGEAL